MNDPKRPHHDDTQPVPATASAGFPSQPHYAGPQGRPQQQAPWPPPGQSGPSTHRYDDGRGGPGNSYDTRAWGPAPGGPGQPPYYGGPTLPPPTGDRPRQTSRGTFTAGLLAATLVVGGVAGIGGAAGYNALTSGPEPAGTTSVVAPSKDGQIEPHSAEAVANVVLPSVVKINVQGAQGAGSGSGIILSSNGEILTNYHVVQLAQGGGSVSVGFNNGKTVPAKVIGTDPLTDLAIIKAQGVSGLTPATLGHSSSLDVGEQVVAIGSPFGLQSTVTSGIVSALNRAVSVGSSGSGMDTAYPAIQTDAAINPGNSGGPLVNMQGQVVGINSSIRTASSSLGGEGGSIGLGFAIPIDEALPIVHQLQTGQTPTHARLGVSVTDASANHGLLSGAGIASVTPGSAAAQAGLKRGDIVTKVDNQPIQDASSLVATIRGHRPGDPVNLTVVRGGQTVSFKATLNSDKGSPSS